MFKLTLHTLYIVLCFIFLGFIYKVSENVHCKSKNSEKTNPLISNLKIKNQLLNNELLMQNKSQTIDIPHIFHQTWFGDINRLGSHKRSLMKNCQIIHENAGWRYMLWTLDNISNVRPSVGHLSHQEWFNSVPHLRHQQSDIARYEILWEYGGVYADADTECLKSFDELGNNMNEAECYAGIEAEWEQGDFPEFQTSEFPHGLIAQGTIGCIPHSSTMMAMIVGLSAVDKGKEVWIASGPYFFTQTIITYALPVKILPSWVFYPIHHGKKPKSNSNNVNSFANHHWGTTKNTYHIR